jgi:hypothetical protein
VTFQLSPARVAPEHLSFDAVQRGRETPARPEPQPKGEHKERKEHKKTTEGGSSTRLRLKNLPERESLKHSSLHA